MNNLKKEKLKSNEFFFEVVLGRKCRTLCNGCMMGSHKDMIGNDYNQWDLESFEESFKHLSKLDENNNFAFNLLGGEPFEIDNILEYPKIIRKYFKYSKIDFLTTGVLLVHKSDDFLSEIKKLNITLCITKYPDFEKIIDALTKRLDKLHLAYCYHKSDTEKDNTNRCWFMRPLSYRNEFYDKKENFDSCTSDCLTLHNNKMYSCTSQLSILGRNKLYNTDYTIDTIDINDIKTLEDIVKFANTPSDFCKYCTIGSNLFETNEDYRIKWKRVAHIKKDDYIIEN